MRQGYTRIDVHSHFVKTNKTNVESELFIQNWWKVITELACFDLPLLEIQFVNNNPFVYPCSTLFAAGWLAGVRSVSRGRGVDSRHRRRVRVRQRSRTLAQRVQQQLRREHSEQRRVIAPQRRDPLAQGKNITGIEVDAHSVLSLGEKVNHNVSFVCTLLWGVITDR